MHTYTHTCIHTYMRTYDMRRALWGGSVGGRIDRLHMYMCECFMAGCGDAREERCGGGRGEDIYVVET